MAALTSAFVEDEVPTSRFVGIKHLFSLTLRVDAVGAQTKLTRMATVHDALVLPRHKPRVALGGAGRSPQALLDVVEARVGERAFGRLAVGADLRLGASSHQISSPAG